MLFMCVFVVWVCVHMPWVLLGNWFSPSTEGSSDRTQVFRLALQVHFTWWSICDGWVCCLWDRHSLTEGGFKLGLNSSSSCFYPEFWATRIIKQTRVLCELNAFPLSYITSYLTKIVLNQRYGVKCSMWLIFIKQYS